MISSDGSSARLAELSAPLQQALADRLLAMADDELILAHRNSEWCGHAPILEEDIAFANLAQDELGHAGLWYGLLQQLNGAEPDRLVYFRPASDFRNIRMLELPNGDWAFSMLRQYLFDSYEMLLLDHLAAAPLPPLAQAAAKARQEEIYHLRHTRAWVRRLGLGTDESQQRMQQALETLWPYAAQLFSPLPRDERLVAARLVPALDALGTAWFDVVAPFLEASGLQLTPASAPTPASSEVGDEAGRDVHTEHLSQLVEELQSVARADPQASW